MSGVHGRVRHVKEHRLRGVMILDQAYSLRRVKLGGVTPHVLPGGRFVLVQVEARDQISVDLDKKNELFLNFSEVSAPFLLRVKIGRVLVVENWFKD